MTKARKRFVPQKRTWVMLSVVALMLLLNLLSWCSVSFSDWYAEKLFPQISRVFSRIFGWSAVSFGEVMIGIAIALAVILAVTFLALMLIKRGKRWRIACCYGRIIGWILTYILVTETCNCFVLYHATPFGERYFSPQVYTGQDLLELYVDLAETANQLAPQVARDSDGNFVLQDNLYETANAAMQRLGETYPQFRGYYPKPKAIHASYLMSQMNLTGIYLPFSMEANYNRDMLDINLPDTVCHEFSHLRGCIQEDEAGFMSYLACVGSDSPDFQYSGVVTALEYVQNAVAVREITGKEDALAVLTDAVKQDMFEFLPDNYWHEQNAVHPTMVATETVRSASSAAMDTSLKLNGVDDGKQSYSRIVTLLLAHWTAEHESAGGE